ncbi:paraquat-inducible protein A [Pirellula sp. SH-Sr6A]|uniref:paraquat-inducible protein A n=1 Tax=Pirellula sp. SH-Sr6A TaxID=1632865 RepID=UPI0011BAB17A|nr:paraquat-inducible protein A [Pirellula sp. SH-Sr6A]
MKLKACHCCGLVHRMPEASSDCGIPGSEARNRNRVASCRRCHAPLNQNVSPAAMRSRVAALTISSLALFPPAILLPIVEIEKLGHHHQSSLLSGIRDLFQVGEWRIGIIIFVFSILFPLAKLLILLELSWVQILTSNQRSLAYRWMERVGKWSMLDVLLLAILVMWIKLQGLVAFQFGPAIFAFALCVIMSLLAALALDPHALWEEIP